MSTILDKRRARRRQFSQATADHHARTQERLLLSALIEVLIGRLDELDGDPDLEPDADSEDTHDREEDRCDFDPSLAL